MLDAGYVHVEVLGAPDEMYIWPYFARYPVEALTPPQLVELLKLVFSGDYEDMKSYGAYISYRVGLAPDGASTGSSSSATQPSAAPALAAGGRGS